MATDEPSAVTPGDVPKPGQDQVSVGLESALDRFARSFEASAKRWEIVVYPSLFAFAVLAAYGFFLIYSLAKDMSTLAQNVDPKMAANMDALSQHVGDMSGNMERMRREITKMATHIEQMDTSILTLNESVASMTKTLERMETHTLEISDKLSTLGPILSNMQLMNESMGRMTLSTGIMSRESTQMGRPMEFMNRFAPW